MLTGISPLLSPELLATLYQMGHGDEIVLADAHFPGHSCNARVLRADGLRIAPLLDAILPLFALDTYVDDPLGHMRITAEGYGELAASLKRMAENNCDGKIVFYLEGGYNLDGLVTGVKRVIEVLGDINPPDLPDTVECDDDRFNEFLEVLKETFGSYWDF